MSAANTSWAVWREPEVASEFRQRRMAVPGAEAQLDVMLKLIGTIGEVTTILDVGCGDGILLETVLDEHPQATGVGIDGSLDMLSAARARFAARHAEPPSLIEADFDLTTWVERLPVRPFDAIVSGFAIHHSTDERKRALYREMFDLLRPGGVFVNLEHVASASPLGERLFELTYAENQARYREACGEAVTVERVLQEMTASPAKSANKLAQAAAQLDWLREIGYVDVDCYWKWFELAVLGGFRPGAGA